MNESSSRSHFLALTSLYQKEEAAEDRHSTLYAVDLAGSEKTSKTKAEGQQLEEAKHINLSLLTLGKIIAGLSGDIGARPSYLPYRDSKITRLLQNSFGGNSRTTLLLCISLNPLNKSETISTLRFGKNAGKITNQAKINTRPTVEKLQAEILQARREIDILREGQAPLMPLLRLYEEQIRDLHALNEQWKTEYASIVSGVVLPPQLALYASETQRLRDENGALKLQLSLLEKKIKFRDERTA